MRSRILLLIRSSKHTLSVLIIPATALQVDSVVADVARATFRKEKGRGGETSGGDAGGYAKRREAMVAAYYVATAEEFAGASKHQVPG